MDCFVFLYGLHFRRLITGDIIYAWLYLIVERALFIWSTEKHRVLGRSREDISANIAKNL